MNNHSIKRGVSLYSYQEEFFLKKMSLEDCIAATAATGATGIEIVGEQSVPGCPNIPSDAFIAQWFEWMEKYGVTPVAHDMFLDYNKKKGHYWTDEEAVESFKKDIRFASALGFKVIRVIVNTTPEIIEKIIPYAEDHDIKLGIEVHAPWHINSAWMTRHWEVMEKTGTKHFGFIPDMGGFTKRLAPVIVDRLIRQGADPKIAAYVCEQHEKGVMAEYTIYEVSRMSDRRIDMAVAELSRHNTFANPISLLQHIDRIVHVYGKFYDMTEDFTEPSIPYKEVIDVLIKGGYDGYISSEYEGNRHIQDIQEVDSVKQVKRHQQMLVNYGVK
ncbi:sugar phosphate isomerase/epimerase family protein [Maribacter sp. CXY002]|uniref:sugar phosphate isomerase/epimerase family protein n=1 Tax=Maribacter luteocoastalis TaxID=3407671 RepID=UPI003B67222C